MVKLQLNLEFVNIAWSKARTAKDIPKVKSLRTEKESLSRQLRDLGESVLTRDELTNRVTALYEKLNRCCDELVNEDTDESIDAAEKCHEALTQLKTQMALVGIALSVTGDDAPVKSDSESDFKVGDNAITLAKATAQHRSDILFASFEVSSFLKGRKKHEVVIKLNTTSRSIAHEAAMLKQGRSPCVWLSSGAGDCHRPAWSR